MTAAGLDISQSSDDILLDPLRGEIFQLSRYIASGASRDRPAVTNQADGNELTILMSKILVGPPPESTALVGPHVRDSIVLVSNLPPMTTDGFLKRECVEVAERPKFIYMHVSDVRTGVFSGTAVVEFSNAAAAATVCKSGLLGCPVRPVTEPEFSSLTTGEWPMLEYGPPRGVFGTQQVHLIPQPAPVPAPVPSWANPNRPPPSNPWQR